MKQEVETGIVHRMTHWGYSLLPKRHEESPGWGGLLVAIRDQPTLAHYDPETMRIRVVDRAGNSGYESYHLQPPARRTMRACMGRVYLRDRKGKSVEFFTFGGQLEVIQAPGETIYALFSSAPILWLTSDLEGIADQLVFEIESLEAELEAHWPKDGPTLHDKTATFEAAQIYIASIISLLERYEQSRELGKSHRDLRAALLKEKEVLVEADQWPELPENLETILTR